MGLPGMPSCFIIIKHTFDDVSRKISNFKSKLRGQHDVGIVALGF